MPYRIKTVAQMTGVPKNTLIAWERRYGLVTPQRSDNGYRVYSDEDVARIMELTRLRDDGLQISEAVAVIQARAVGPVPGAEASTDTGLDTLCASVLEALLEGDRGRADELLLRASSLSYRQLISSVFLPVARAVGDAWADGAATVSQEHFASAYLCGRLAAMLHQLEAGPLMGPEVICGTLPGERHEVGLLALAVRLALSGHHVHYLGPDLPLDDLVSAVAERGPAAVALSMVNDDAPELRAKQLSTLRGRLPDSVMLVIGGPGATAELAQDNPGTRYFASMGAFTLS